MTEFQSQKEPERSRSTSFSSSNSSDSGAGSTGGSNSSSSSGFNFSQLIVPGAALLLLFGIVQGLSKVFQPKAASSAKLVELEQSASLSRSQMMKEAPRYGLEDVRVRDSVARVILRDNAAEDGDVISFSINGQPYSGTVALTNAGMAFDVPLNRGPNLMAVYGTKDGMGGITFSAEVVEGGKSTTTMNLTPFPEGEVAQFYLIRR